MDYAKKYGGIIILCLIFSLFIAAMAGMFLTAVDKGRIGEGTDVVESHEIVALKTSDNPESTTQGFAFVVFNSTSTTSHNDTYTVLTRGDDGGYSSYDFPASDTTIYEVKDDFRVEVEQGYVEYYSRFWGKENNTEHTGDKRYKLYIPEGSLVLNGYDAGWNE